MLIPVFSLLIIFVLENVLINIYLPSHQTEMAAMVTTMADLDMAKDFDYSR